MKAVAHQSIRMCVACRARLPKSTLQRYIKERDTHTLDVEQIKQARGFYVCSQKCLESVEKRMSNKSHKRKEKGM